MKKLCAMTLTLTAFILQTGISQVLEVKPGTSAIVKVAPTGDAQAFPDRLAAGTRVDSIGEASLYYVIRLADGRVGWSYKGKFFSVSGNLQDNSFPPTKESLLARSDVLKIVVVDVEVGDATLIICPTEQGKRDVILVDTGEDDADRIKAELTKNGFEIADMPISRMFITHYDDDHFGDASRLVPLSRVVYDHGDNNIKNSKGMSAYLDAVQAPTVDRRAATLNYQETFSGGVDLECVAVNQATDFDPTFPPSTPGDNENSVALLLSYKDFDYFTGGDLTFKAEKSLAKGIKNCDVYHVNHHGSRATSSDSLFLQKLDPELAIASNGTMHGHPSKDVMDRLASLGCVHVQTNLNQDPRAYQANLKYIADDTVSDDDEAENEEGALGTIVVVVDAAAGKYYVIMEGLDLSEGTFPIEH